MVAARMRCCEGKIECDEYILLLKSLEIFAYRVYLFDGRRSNAGKSNFYRWAYELFSGKHSIESITTSVHGLIRHYASEESFTKELAAPGKWYSWRSLLKYTLYEYELHLLHEFGHDIAPKIKWDALGDSTIEHIYPQNPDDESHWNKVWSPEDKKTYLHDIGNLVLTMDNSSYRNYDFARKRFGKAGLGPSYRHSDIRQERDIALDPKYDDWTPDQVQLRRNKLVKWISDRWRSIAAEVQDVDDESADMDENEQA
jgi:hypothetical protein